MHSEHPACSALRSFKLPDHLRLSNVEGLVTDTAEVHSAEPGSGVAQTFASQIDPSLTWAFVAWLRSVCGLPIFIKARVALACLGSLCLLALRTHSALITLLCRGPRDENAAWKDWQMGRFPMAFRGCAQGVLSAADAERALEAGVDGIVVSNHGGRQLDGARCKACMPHAALSPHYAGAVLHLAPESG